MNTLIQGFFNLFKRNMSNVDNKRFIPTREEISQGKTAMDKSEIIAALAAYKRQNPAKYETKKEALFAKYNIDIEPVEEIDAEIVKLEEAAKKAKKLNIV